MAGKLSVHAGALRNPSGQLPFLGLLSVPGVPMPPCFLARHASEQYLTSSQFLAQLLRQVISRPQTAQVLLGSDALLPLKPLKTMRRTPLLAEGVVVVVRIGAVVAAPQLHRHIFVGVGNPLDAQKRRSLLHFQ